MVKWHQGHGGHDIGIGGVSGAGDMEVQGAVEMGTVT